MAFNFNNPATAGGFNFNAPGAPAAPNNNNNNNNNNGNGNADDDDDHEEDLQKQLDDLFAMPSRAIPLLQQFYEKYQKLIDATANGTNFDEALLAQMESTGGTAAPRRKIYRSLDPEILVGEETAALEDSDCLPAKKVANTRFANNIDVAFTLAEMWGRTHEAAVDDDADNAAVEESVPPPFIYHMAYLLSYRCAQCGRCDIETTLLLTRDRGHALCRRMPICGPCVRTTRILGRMSMAQTAQKGQILRGDAATMQYMQHADSIVFSDPFLVQYVATSDAIKTATTVRYLSMVPDCDVTDLAGSATSLEHFIYGGNLMGHPEIIAETLTTKMQLRTLELCTGPMLPWVLEGVLKACPPLLESLRISCHKSRNDMSDSAELDAELVFAHLAKFPAPPKLTQLILFMSARTVVGTPSELERVTPSMVAKFAASEIAAQLEKLRLHVPFARDPPPEASDEDSAAAAAPEDTNPVVEDTIVRLFSGLTNLRELRVINTAAEPAAATNAGFGAPEDNNRRKLSTVPPSKVPDHLEHLTTDAVAGAMQPNGNQTLRSLAVQVNRRVEHGMDVPLQMQVLPEFKNLRTLTLTIDINQATGADFASLQHLYWLEECILIGDSLFALAPLSHLDKHLRVLYLDYSPPRDPIMRGSITVEPNERYNWLDVEPLRRMKALRRLGIRGLRDLDVLRPDLFDGSFSLTLLELISCFEVTDEIVTAAVEQNPGLEVMTLSELPKVTNRGVSALEDLKVLRDLSVVRCEHVTERGLLRLGERCRALQVVSLEAGLNDNYIADSLINKLATRAKMSLKFPDMSLGYQVQTIDGRIY